MQFDAHVTRVDDDAIAIESTPEGEQHTLHYPQAPVRFTLGQLLHVRGHRVAGQVTIDAIQ